MACKGITAAGAPCSAKAKTGDYCGRHTRAATVAEGAAARAAEQERLFAKAASEMAEATKHMKAASVAAAAARIRYDNFHQTLNEMTRSYFYVKTVMV